MLHQAGQPVRAPLDNIGLLTTSLAASTYLTSATAAATYFPKTGGTLSGSLAVTGNITTTGTLDLAGGCVGGNGVLWLRPNGVGNDSGRTTIDGSGNITAANAFYGTSFIASGTAGFSQSGVLWNGTLYVQYVLTGNPSWGTIQEAFVHVPGVWAGVQWDVGGQAFSFRSNGTAYKAGGGAWADPSDVRIKNILGNYNQGLKELRTLHPKRFSYKGNDTDGPPEEGDTVPYQNSGHRTVAENGTVYYGVTAQDVEPKFPEMVTRQKGYIDGVEVPDLRILDTSALIWALVNAADELANMDEALTARVTELENAP